MNLKHFLSGLAIVAVLTAAIDMAVGQSSPGLRYGQVPTAAQWNSYFAAKQDVLGFVPVNKAGDTMAGELIVATSTGAKAGLNLPPGSAPSVPIDGDLWTTTSGLFVRINGATIGPFTGPNTNQPLTVNQNTSALQGAQAGTLFQGEAADGAIARMELDSFGAIASYSGVVAGGTAAAPTAVTSGTQMTGINAFAYNGSSFVGPIVSFRTYAAENIASGHQGSKACIATTPTASTTSADSFCQQPDGGITVGEPTGGSEGAGTVNLPGNYYINGTPIPSLTSIAANSVLANFTGSSAIPIGNQVNGGSSCGDATHALKFTPGSGFGCQAITVSAAAGGSNTQVQYNNAAALGGISGVTSDGTAMTFADGDLKLAGGTSGTAVLKAPATGGNTFTLPVTSSDTITTNAATETLSGKSISGATNTLSAIALSSLASQAADTIVGRYAGTSGAPTAGALTSCSGATSAVTYNTSTHAWGCNTLAPGSPGGSATTLQFNNSGSFGGITNTATDGLGKINLGSTASPQESLDVASVGTGIGWYNTADEVTNVEKSLCSWVTNVWTCKTSSAGTGLNRAMSFISANAINLSAKTSGNAGHLQINGTDTATWNSTGIIPANGSGAEVVTNAAASVTVPTLIPNATSTTTGFGADTSGDISAIIGGAETMRWAGGHVLHHGSTPTISMDSPTVAQTCLDTCNDHVGRFSANHSSSIVTLTFASAWPVAPVCYMFDETGNTKNPFKATTTSTTSIVFGAAASIAVGEHVAYICEGAE